MIRYLFPPPLRGRVREGGRAAPDAAGNLPPSRIAEPVIGRRFAPTRWRSDLPRKGGGEKKRHSSVEEKASSLFVAFIATVALSLFCTLALAQTFPPLSGRVVDQAAILDLQTEALLEGKLADLEAKTTNQVVVVTLKSLENYDIADYGYRLGRQWQVGQKGKNNGALLIVAPSERKVRIEVGYGLEGSLTDAVTRLIIENAITPRFRAGDFPGGITRGVDDIVSVLTGDAKEWQQRAAQRPDAAPPGVDLVTLLFVAFIIFLIVRSITRGSGSRLNSKRRGGSSSGPVWFPSSGGSSWGGGGSSSGGGFSGGGGSFGGGGSSGSW